MKKRTLVLIRHAKTKPAGLLQDDYDRRLSDRGEKDAPEMGNRLRRHRITPDLIVSSTAIRAAQTARAIAALAGYDENRIQWEQQLYLCAPETFESVLSLLPANVTTVFIIAHNPGITEFVNTLSPHYHIDNLPTCGIVGVHVTSGSWPDFPTSKKEVFLSDYPKKHI